MQLWSADHTVQGLLQSVELNHKCFYHSANSKDLYNLETYYPEYLELFKQLKSQFASRKGKKSAVTNQANGTSIFAPGVTSAGGKKAAVTNQTNGTSIFAPGLASKGGKKAAVTNQVNGTSIFAPGMASAGGKKGSATTNAQKWQCLETGFITNPGGLSRYQKKRGIDTSLRVRILDLQG